MPDEPVVSPADLPPAPRLPTRGVPVRRAARARTLSRESIVDAALQIIDSEGLDAMTMRTVAHLLGTGPASLYAHVSSKEDLLELVIDRVIGEANFEIEPDPARWQEQIKEGLRTMRDTFARHGDLARASFARIPLGENALTGMDRLLAVLRAGGLSDSVVAMAGDLLALYTMAVAYEESLYAAEGSTREQFDEYISSMRAYMAGLPPERFPNTVALAAALTAGDDNERFEFGLEVLIRGLAAMPE